MFVKHIDGIERKAVAAFRLLLPGPAAAACRLRRIGPRAIACRLQLFLPFMLGAALFVAGCGGDSRIAGREPIKNAVTVETNVDALRVWVQEKAKADALWRDLAILQAKDGDVDGAPTPMDAAIHRQEQAILYDCQGLLRIKAGDFPGAAESYRRLLELEPTCAEAHRRLAGLYQKMGDSNRARAHLANVGRTEGRSGVPMSASSRHFPEQGAAGD